MIGLILVAAGSGQRLGADVPKALVRVAGDTLIGHCLQTAAQIPELTQIVVVAPPGIGPLPDVNVVAGGATRDASVRAGLDALDPATTAVLVHDAARPFAPAAVFERVIAALQAGAVRVAASLQKGSAALEQAVFTISEVPTAGVSVVGARPFSWGGQSLRSPELYDEIYGIHTMRQSAAAIVDAARHAQHRDLVILAHNGPLGLGEQPADMFGKDFGKPGGDWGDRDLALAIQRIEGMGLRVRAVVAGHMHHKLVHPRGALRTRFARRGGTLFLNAAFVPRVRADGQGGECSHFLRTHWRHGECTHLEEVWVDVHGGVHEIVPVEVLELAGAAPVVDEQAE